MTSPEEDRWYGVALDLVKSAGKIVRDAYEMPVSAFTTKSSNTDLVTESDQKVEKLLIDGLSKQFPNHKFIGEESVADGGKIEFTDSPTWIIDPIDGTTNFVHRIPMLAICLGLTVKKQLRIGIVYNPITNELFTARLGQGAYKNGFRIRVSNTEELCKSVLASTLGIHNAQNLNGCLDKSVENSRRQVEHGIRGYETDLARVIFCGNFKSIPECDKALVSTQVGSQRHFELIDTYLKSFHDLMLRYKCQGQRSFGSAAINIVYVAQGSLDAYVEYGLHCWDVAAAVLILFEAGGVAIDPNGAEFNMMSRKILCSSTKTLASQLSGILTHIDYEPEA